MSDTKEVINLAGYSGEEYKEPFHPSASQPQSGVESTTFVSPDEAFADDSVFEGADSDPNPNGMAAPKHEDIRESIYQDDGELVGYASDIKNALKPVTPLVKRVSKHVGKLLTSGMRDEERTRKHDEVSDKQRPHTEKNRPESNTVVPKPVNPEVVEGIRKATQSGIIPTTKLGGSTRKPKNHG